MLLRARRDRQGPAGDTRLRPSPSPHPAPPRTRAPHQQLAALGQTGASWRGAAPCPARGCRTLWRVQDPPGAPVWGCQPFCPLPFLRRVPSAGAGMCRCPGSALCPSAACPGCDPSCSRVMPTRRLAPVPIASPGARREPPSGGRCWVTAEPWLCRRCFPWPGPRGLWRWWHTQCRGGGAEPRGHGCRSRVRGAMARLGTLPPRGGPHAASPSPWRECGARGVLSGATR